MPLVDSIKIVESTIFQVTNALLGKSTLPGYPPPPVYLPTLPLPIYPLLPTPHGSAQEAGEKGELIKCVVNYRCSSGRLLTTCREQCLPGQGAGLPGQGGSGVTTEGSGGDGLILDVAHIFFAI